MGLQSLKQEIRALPSIGSDLQGFKKHWLSPLRKGQKCNKAQQGLHEMHPDDKSKIHSTLKGFYSQFSELEGHTILPEKLHALSSALVEMKLLSLRGAENGGKMSFLQGKVLDDPQFSLSNTITEIKSFDEKLSQIETLYHDVNGYLHQTLSLEHSVALLELPHYAYLKNLKETAKHQKRIVKKLGREFVSLQRKLERQKKKQQRASN